MINQCPKYPNLQLGLAFILIFFSGVLLAWVYLDNKYNWDIGEQACNSWNLTGFRGPDYFFADKEGDKRIYSEGFYCENSNGERVTVGRYYTP